MRTLRSALTAACTGALFLGFGTVAIAQDAEPVPVTPIKNPDDARSHGLESLRAAIEADGGVPLPDKLRNYVADYDAALKLGKALFWDERVGSDGMACASCHFHAGADSRPINQLNPNLTRVKDQRDGNVKGYHNAMADPDTGFELLGNGLGPNYTLYRDDFPFVTNPDKVQKSGDTVSAAAGNVNDVASSSGVFFQVIHNTVPGARFDVLTPLDDDVFQVGGASLRRVEPRNTPSVINSVLNFVNFWDGRANNRFNGQNPFGDQDPNAHIWIAQNSNGEGQSSDKLDKVRPALDNASLASQAVGPPLSEFEMGGLERYWPLVGRKLIPAYALADQEVSSQDSVLGALANAGGTGLTVTYNQLVEQAFQDKLWQWSGDPVTINGEEFTQREFNFPFMFGVAVMLYEATLVADSSPFDQWMETGKFNSGFGKRELAGLNLFVDKGKCVNCHSGPEMTNASVRNYQGGNNAIEAMQMARGNALYDNGFYNIGVTPTVEDLGRGGKDLNGKPLAFSRQSLFKRLGIDDIRFKITGHDDIHAVSEEGLPVCDDLNGDGFCSGDCVDVDLDGICDGTETITAEFRRAAVDGAFKSPTVRNTELTGPYFHNGSAATLRQVVQFYNRGGNFCGVNQDDLDPDIRRLGMSDSEEMDLVAFMVSLTDERVRFEEAPFDRPGISIPFGHPGDETWVESENVDGVLRGVDTQRLDLAPVGASGGNPIATFLGLDPQDEIFKPADCSPQKGKGNGGGGKGKNK